MKSALNTLIGFPDPQHNVGGMGATTVLIGVNNSLRQNKQPHNLTFETHYIHIVPQNTGLDNLFNIIKYVSFFYQVCQFIVISIKLTRNVP
jgi:hypothetical protein